MSALELLAESPTIWRYPELAATLIRRRPAPAEAAGLLLRGIARPRHLDQALADLIARGDFDAADKLLEHLTVTDGSVPDLDPKFDVAAAESELANARAQARLRVQALWDALNERAARVGLTRESGESAVKESARRIADALVLVDARAETVTEVEERRRQELLAQLPGESATWPEWATAVRTAIDAQEFQLAAGMLSTGPSRAIGTGPLLIPNVPGRWIWPGASWDTVMARYSHAGGGAITAAENRYLPAHDDLAASRLVDALRGLRSAPDPESANVFVGSLADIAGCSVESVTDPSGLTVFKLRWPAEDDLPGIFPALHGGLRLVVGDISGSVNHPPADTVVFRAELGARDSAPDDTLQVLLDAQDILLLLARTQSVPSPEQRRANLLRTALRRMPPAALLAEGVQIGRAPRVQLAWVFDLLGLIPDGLVLDYILLEVGEHPLALRTVLLALLATLDGRPGITLDDVRATTGPEMDDALRVDVLSTVAEGTTVWAVLWLTLLSFGGDDVFTTQRTYQELSAMAGPRGEDRLVDAQSVADALGELVRMRILREAPDGFRLPPARLTAALLSSPLEFDAVAAALEAHAGELDEAAAALIGPLVARALGHRVDNEVLGIGRLLERVLDQVEVASMRDDIEQALIRVRGLGGGAYTRFYFESLTPRRRVDLSDLVRRVASAALDQVPAGVSVVAELGGRDYYVQAVPALLENCLLNLIRNAADALEAGSGWARPTIRLALRDAPLSGRPRRVTATDRAVVIDTIDNGPGFAAQQLEQLRSELNMDEDVRRRASSLARGRGLSLTSALVRHFNGDLNIDNLGGQPGAHVSIWLPLAVEPSAIGAESPGAPPRPDATHPV